jgi:hypothetical protein
VGQGPTGMLEVLPLWVGRATPLSQPPEGLSTAYPEPVFTTAFLGGVFTLVFFISWTTVGEQEKAGPCFF